MAVALALMHGIPAHAAREIVYGSPFHDPDKSAKCTSDPPGAPDGRCAVNATASPSGVLHVDGSVANGPSGGSRYGGSDAHVAAYDSLQRGYSFVDYVVRVHVTGGRISSSFTSGSPSCTSPDPCQRSSVAVGAEVAHEACSSCGGTYRVELARLVEAGDMSVPAQDVDIPVRLTEDGQTGVPRGLVHVTAYAEGWATNRSGIGELATTSFSLDATVISVSRVSAG